MRHILHCTSTCTSAWILEAYYPVDISKGLLNLSKSSPKCLHVFLYLSLIKVLDVSQQLYQKNKNKAYHHRLTFYWNKLPPAQCHPLVMFTRPSTKCFLHVCSPHTHFVFNVNVNVNSGLHVLKKDACHECGGCLRVPQWCYFFICSCYHMYEHLSSLMGSSCCHPTHRWPQNC